MFFKQKSVSEKVVMLAALGLLGGVLLSWPLWDEAARLWFPTLPLWGEAVEPPSRSWEDVVGLAGLVGLSLCTFVFSEKKMFLSLLVVWLAGFCAFDLNRLQPWVWFYLLVFSVIVFGKKEDENAKVNALRWLLAGVYFWSGFNKLTPYFAENDFAWFCEAFAFTKFLGKYPALGYALALLEMSFAAGLLWERTRLYFRLAVVGFHSVVVIFLIKLDWNWVVIPWNLAMAWMVWTLYFGRSPVSTPPPTPPLKERGVVAKSPNTLRLPFFLGEGSGAGLTWLAPLLSFFHLWPHALSWQLYSNTQPEASFFSEKGGASANAELSLLWEKHAYDDSTKLLLDDWANDELKVPMFNSTRTFRQVGEYLCPHFDSDEAGLLILTVHRWDKSAEKMEKISCRELMMNEK